jgi:hypothetical protein
MGTVRSHFVLFFVCGALVTAAPQSSTEQRSAAVKGTVTNAATGDRLRKAFLRLEDSKTRYPAATDDSGAFAIEGVRPGVYTLTVERQGFIEAKYGEDAGSIVQLRLEPGQTLTNIKVALIPQGIISGRVVDEDGELWTHAYVNLFRAEWKRGRRTVRGLGGADVNDQGEFRIGQIPPGRYYLQAVPDSYWEKRNRSGTEERPSQRQPTWHPGSLEVEGATSIVIAPGNQIAGLEIRLRRAEVHTIRGVVSGGQKVPAFPDRGPFGERSIAAWPEFGNAYTGALRPDGSFEIQGVPSGHHDLRVSQGMPPIMLGATKVQVTDRDLDGVSVTLKPPGPLKGVIRIAEGESLKPGQLRLSLDSFAGSMLQSAISREDGSFDFAIVDAERHRVRVTDAGGAALYVKEIRQGDAHSKDGTFTPAGSEANLILTISTRGARLSGTILNRPNASSTPQVVLISNAEPSETRIARFDQNGRFSFENLRPGTFTAYAFESVPDGAWEDPDFLNELGSSGVRVELTDDEQKSIEVSLRSKAELLPILRKLGLE